MKRTWLVPALAGLVFSTACASTIPHARRIASAGAAYGKACDALLGVAEEKSVDADSARLLSEGQGVSREDRRALLERHAAASELVAELERLRQHARLLTRYFETLGSLADDAADTEAGEQIAGVAGALNNVGQALSGSRLLSSDETDLLSKAARLTVRSVRNRALDRELIARADAIDRELRIQQALLSALRRKLQADIASIATLGRERDVTRPFVEATITDPRGWIALRRGYLLAPRGVEALSDASDAASKLRSAWAAFVEGRFDEAAQAGLMTDLDEIVAFAESAKAALK